jgi:hypothetical protein
MASNTTQVNVKLAPGADRRRAAAFLAALPGVEDVVQLFPDEADEELAGLYVIEVDAPELETALHELGRQPDVEYAEEAAPRKLIH